MHQFPYFFNANTLQSSIFEYLQMFSSFKIFMILTSDLIYMFIYIYRLNKKKKTNKFPFSTIEILLNPIPWPEIACDLLSSFFT